MEEKARKSFDVQENIRARKYSHAEMSLRLVWTMGRSIYRMTPRPCFSLRRYILRMFGATIGKGVRTYSSTDIYFPWNLTIGEYSSMGENVLVYSLGKVTIGNRVTISQRAHLCAGSHDYHDPAMPLTKPPIYIGDDVWICADAYIGPGVRVSNLAIVAARGVVVKDVAIANIVGGNPAKFIKLRD